VLDIRPSLRKEDSVTRPTVLALLALVALAVPLRAQEPVTGATSPQDAERIHNELRTLRDGLVKATNDANIDALLALLHPNVVVTWQNAEVSRGRDGVRAYLTRMMSGPNKVVSHFQTTPTVDELTILYGDSTGVAFGSSHDRFDLTNGMTFDLNGRWSATLVREGGRWLVASFHASTNIFDNPVLDATQKSAVWTGAGGLIVGGLVAMGAMLILRGRRRQRV
jgi:hypothetical protein